MPDSETIKRELLLPSINQKDKKLTHNSIQMTCDDNEQSSKSKSKRKYTNRNRANTDVLTNRGRIKCNGGVSILYLSVTSDVCSSS